MSTSSYLEINPKIRKYLQAAELLKKGESVRQVAVKMHLSFGAVALAGRLASGELTVAELDKPEAMAITDEKRLRKLSEEEKIAEAYRLFSQGRQPVDVAATLALRLDFVDGLYVEYLDSTAFYQFGQLCKQLGYAGIRDVVDVKSSLDALKLNSADAKQQLLFAKRMYELGKSIAALQAQNKRELDALEERRRELASVNKEIEQAKTLASRLEAVCSGQIRESESISKKVELLQEQYRHVKPAELAGHIAEQRASAILNNNNLLMAVGLQAVITAVRNYPEFAKVILYEEYPNYVDPAGGKDAFQKAYRQQLLQISEEYWNQLMAKILDRRLYPQAIT